MDRRYGFTPLPRASTTAAGPRMPFPVLPLSSSVAGNLMPATLDGRLTSTGHFGCNVVLMTSTRSYRMSARAAGAEATRDRIVQVACEAFDGDWYDHVKLRAIAAEAGVALQTVLNHFPTKEALFLAASERSIETIEKARWSLLPGDVTAAVTGLVDDYERNGDATVRFLAVEERVPVVGPHIRLGRQEHERWVQVMFPIALEGLTGAEHRRRVTQLVAVTDVYTWKLLRRDKRLSRNETIKAICELVLALHNPQGGG